MADTNLVRTFREFVTYSINVPLLIEQTVMDGGALHSLYKGGPPAQPAATSPVTLRAKAVVLYERTFRMSTSAYCTRWTPSHISDCSSVVSKGNVRWDEFRSLELSIAQFTTNLPYVSRQSRQGSPSNNEVDFVNIYALIFASSIHLHRGLADSNPASYEKCLVAANSMTSSVRDLSDGDYDFLDPIISVRHSYVSCDPSMVFICIGASRIAGERRLMCIFACWPHHRHRRSNARSMLSIRSWMFLSSL